MARKRLPSALKLLRASESSAVLDALLKAHPDLVAEAETLAVGMLDDTTWESVAEQVEHALRSLPLESLGQRAGYHPGRGYTHEGDAAAEIVEETLAPYLDDITRRLILGRPAPAHQVAAGVLAGLHACDGEHDGDVVLGYAGDMDNYPFCLVCRNIVDHARVPCGPIGFANAGEGSCSPCRYPGDLVQGVLDLVQRRSPAAGRRGRRRGG